MATQNSAVVTALTAASNVITAVAPEAAAVIALVQLAVTLVNENRDPTPQEWSLAIGTLDDAHAKAQAALAIAAAAQKALVPAPTPPAPAAA